MLSPTRWPHRSALSHVFAWDSFLRPLHVHIWCHGKHLPWYGHFHQSIRVPLHQASHNSSHTSLQLLLHAYARVWSAWATMSAEHAGDSEGAHAGEQHPAGHSHHPGCQGLGAQYLTCRCSSLSSCLGSISCCIASVPLDNHTAGCMVGLGACTYALSCGSRRG